METAAYKSEEMSHIYGVYRCQNDLRLTLNSDARQLSGLFGYSANEIDTCFQNSLLGLTTSDERVKLRASLDAQLAEGDSIEILIPVQHKNGEMIWVLNRGCRMAGADGREYLQGVLVDITRSKQLYDEQKKAQKKTVHDLQEQAEKDELTKLFNVRTARRLAEEYLAREDAGKCALMIIDLDDFKHVNDQYGHMFGNEVLAKAARTISQLFRSQDVVGRIGGDEFIVLMKDVSDRQLVDKRCQQLIAAFGDVFGDKQGDCEISCSIGVVFCEAAGAAYNDLFCCADRALYQAKAQGKNQFVFGQMECQKKER